MGISEKIANARKSSWITEGLSEAEVKTIVELAKISALIENSRVEMGMTQKEFADYMGVSQGMVSKWESREYNFTIRSLNEICEKLHMDLQVEMNEIISKDDFQVMKWEIETIKFPKRDNKWMDNLIVMEEIA